MVRHGFNLGMENRVVNKAGHPILSGYPDQVFADLQLVRCHVRANVIDTGNTFHRFGQGIIIPQITEDDVFAADAPDFISLLI